MSGMEKPRLQETSCSRQKQRQEHVIIRKCVKARRYNKFQHKFAPYSEVVDYLKRTTHDFPDRIMLENIGESKQGKDLYLVIVGTNNKQPTTSTLIEAGSNGREWYSVTSMLYFIDYLVNNPNFTLLMHYYIIPCLNPDAYDYFLMDEPKERKRKKPEKKCEPRIDLSFDFPSVSILPIPYNHCKPYPPEIVAFHRVLDRYKPAIKMFISLKENGRAIYYPWAYTTQLISDVDHLKKVAQAGQKAMQSDVSIGAMAQGGCVLEGAIIDYVKFYHPSIKFVYSVHLSCSGVKREKAILEKGEEVCDGIKAMATVVCKYCLRESTNLAEYHQEEKDKKDETRNKQDTLTDASKYM